MVGNILEADIWPMSVFVRYINDNIIWWDSWWDKNELNLVYIHIFCEIQTVLLIFKCKI